MHLTLGHFLCNIFKLVDYYSLKIRLYSTLGSRVGGGFCMTVAKLQTDVLKPPIGHRMDACQLATTAGTNRRV